MEEGISIKYLKEKAYFYIMNALVKSIPGKSETINGYLILKWPYQTQYAEIVKRT